MNVLIFNSPPAPHLQWCLESIKTNSPNSTVHVITKSGKLAKQFEEIYHHSSNNPYQAILTSLTRWMTFLEYCHENEITEFFTCDSDVLIYCHIEMNAPNLQMAGHTGCCYVRNMATFNKFVQSIFEFYEKKKWRFYLNHLSISDMTVWDEFFEGRDIGGMFHLKTNVPMWDANVALPQGLEMESGIKRIKFINGFPHGFHHDGMWIQLNNLHFWGQYKNQMKQTWELSQSTVGTNEPKEFV